MSVGPRLRSRFNEWIKRSGGRPTTTAATHAPRTNVAGQDNNRTQQATAARQGRTMGGSTSAPPRRQEIDPAQALTRMVNNAYRNRSNEQNGLAKPSQPSRSDEIVKRLTNKYGDT